MYRQHPPPPPPPPTFPEPFPKSRPANRSQNAAGADTTYLQTGRPPGNTHDPRVPSPSAHSSLPQSSVQPPPRGQPPPILRSTYPGSNIPPHEPPPPYEYALHPPAPQPSSGSDSHHPPFPIPFITPRKPTTNSSGPQQPVFQHSTATPIFDHPISSEPLSYLHQQGDFSSNDKRPRQLKYHETAPASVPSELRCGVCKRLSSRHEMERWGGFCSEMHKWEWENNSRR